MGEITSIGRLLSPRGELLASFRQRYRAWRGSRVLQLSIELDPVVLPGDDPWESYYACRFAWSDDAAELWRGVNELRERAEAKRLEAPLYIDIDEGGPNVVLLTGGLPFHRRTDARMLDSLLLVRGERSRSFELGIGMDVKYPLHEAMAPADAADAGLAAGRSPGGTGAGLDVPPGPAQCHGDVLDAARAGRPRAWAFVSGCWRRPAAPCTPGCAPIAPSAPRTD